MAWGDNRVSPFVYSGSGGVPFFHCNWGWGSHHNGYFRANLFDPVQDVPTTGEPELFPTDLDDSKAYKNIKIYYIER